MSLQRNYYEVLGIPPGATTDQIKKKYRELARKFHPDVVQDKVLGQRVFSQINQAYRVLGDPERRALYNTTLNTGPGARPNAPVAASGTQMRPASAAAPPPSSASARLSQAPPPARPIPTPPVRPIPTPPASRPPAAAQTGPVQKASVQTGSPGTSQKAQAVSGLLANADNAIMAGKPIEARAFCVKVLEIDPQNARALEMLGDALALMGQREDAAVQYRNALQAAPSSMIQAKLNRMEEATVPTRTNPPQEEGEKPGGGLFGRFRGRK